jgi:hypothetical protein
MQNEKPRPSLSMFATMDDYKKAMAAHTASPANAVGGSIADDEKFNEFIHDLIHEENSLTVDGIVYHFAAYLDSLLAGSRAAKEAQPEAFEAAMRAKYPLFPLGRVAVRAGDTSVSYVSPGTQHAWNGYRLAVQDGLLFPPSRAEPASQRDANARALLAINDIRNSIIALQTVNWSEHVYPLVAALDAAGYEGMEYPEARKYYGSMLERAAKAEDELAALKELLAIDQASSGTEVPDAPLPSAAVSVAEPASQQDAGGVAGADEIVGHKTFSVEGGGFRHEPLRRGEAAAIMAQVKARERARAELMPDEATARSIYFDAWLRLKELGWTEAIYCPKDGREFEVIEAGSTGVHRCIYSGEWPSGHWLVLDDGDAYPSRPVLYRNIDAAPVSPTPSTPSTATGAESATGDAKEGQA